MRPDTERSRWKNAANSGVIFSGVMTVKPEQKTVKISVFSLTTVVYVLEYVRNQTIHITERRSGQMDKKISKLVKVVRALTQLALEIGTLIAVIKMIAESIL